jgi:serine/threonine protein kinase/tetratricopeptide (TPR) repeat protein
MVEGDTRLPPGSSRWIFASTSSDHELNRKNLQDALFLHGGFANRPIWPPIRRTRTLEWLHMTAGRWDQVERLYREALARPERERAAFLVEACAGDIPLRRNVESLLEHSAATGLATGGGITAAGPPFSSAPAMIDGRQIGSLQIQRLLGTGGMGEVYRAYDTKLNRHVAIKFLSDARADPRAVRRFQREAQTLSSLNHPHILTVYDVGVLDERHYLVTEFVDGGTLRAWAQADHRTWPQIVELLIGVADGLATAHDAGIAHRDIKPENILVARNGYAKVADFGLAKLFDDFGIDARRTTTAARTQPGTVLGTIAYMSPEQAAGRVVDARSDIFSFGTVLYELLAGRPPFEGPTTLEVLQRIQHQPARPLGEATPPALRAIVEKALEKDPASRYQSMREMVVDLRRLIRQTTSEPPVKTDQRSRTALVAGVALALVATVSAATLWRTRPTGAETAPAIRSIAVIPFQNLSRDLDQEYFTDGTTETLISNLAQIHALAVTSRTSVMRYKKTTKQLADIARELGVDAVVEGSVQRVGGRLRVTAQLIRAATDTHLWANNYDRDVGDFLQVQSEVARAIAREIEVQVTPDEDKRLTTVRRVRPEAQDAYLLGRFHAAKNTEDGFRQAIGYFEQAIGAQPDYAPAHAALSLSWSALVSQGSTRLEGSMRSAAFKALELDPNLAEAHTAMASIKNLDWDWTGSERDFRRALELNPDSVVTCGCFANLLARLGRFQEALALAQHAVRLDPLSSEVEMQYAIALFMARKYEEAAAHARKANELEPRNLGALITLASIYQASGQPQEALAAVDRPELSDTLWQGVAYALNGKRDEARRIANLPGSAANPYWVARIYFALGDHDQGFKWLEKAVEARQPVVTFEPFGPVSDSIRSDPRFQVVLAPLKIPVSGRP